MEKEFKYVVQSAARVIEVLEECVRCGTVSIKELSATLGLGKSNIHRFLSTLEMMGYIEQLQERGRYRVTSKLFQLGMQSIQSYDILEQASEACRRISAQSQETVHLVVLNGKRAVFINKISQRNLDLYSGIGKAAPAHCLASGKVLLAGLPPAELEQLLADYSLESFTANTITDKPALVKQLAQVRRQGYAMDLEEFELGVRCVSAPIYRFDGQIAAALSISMLAANTNEEKLINMVQVVKQGAAEISRNLGYLRKKAQAATI